MSAKMTEAILKQFRKMDIYAKHGLPAAKIEEVISSARDWATAHGVVMRSKSNLSLNQHAPFTLFPSPFPAYLHKEAFQVQKDFQTLFHRASLDHEFIESSLKSVIVHDEFTKLQFEMYDKVRKEGIKPKILFDVARSDYMIDQKITDFDTSRPLSESRPYEIKQIEMNMVAASFSGLTSIVAKMHRYICDELEDKSPFDKEKTADFGPIKALGEGMAKAFKAYGNENACVVFVVEEDDRNRYDQRQFEYHFHDGLKKIGITKHIRVKFRSFQDVHKQGELRDSKLFVSFFTSGELSKYILTIENQEVAICYFRTGYTPDSFKNKEALESRLMMERATCIKSPTLAMQLINTKKVQQVLALPDVVEKFITNPDAVKRIRRTFAGLYSLDAGKDGDEATQKALSEPSLYVLKPQREGGGNNFYDDELVNELKRVADKPMERSQYILMERIRPPISKNFLVRHDSSPTFVDCVTELGVFGVRLSVGDEEILNECAGNLMRTKSIETKDGGVASGLALLDTPYLYGE